MLEKNCEQTVLKSELKLEMLNILKMVNDLKRLSLYSHQKKRECSGFNSLVADTRDNLI